MGMKVKLIVIYMLNIIDLIATMLLVKRFGIQIEGNPIGTWLIETNLVWFVKIVEVGVRCWVYINYKKSKSPILPQQSFSWCIAFLLYTTG